MFITKFWNCFDECFPLKTKNVSTKKVNNPWISREIRQAISRRHDMYKLKLEGKIPKELYAKFNTHVNKIIYNAKKDYYSSKLNKVNGDMRKHWSVLNEMLNRKTDNNCPKTIEIDKTSITDTPGISKNFNSHFSKVGKEIQSSVQPTADPMSYLKNIKHSSKFKFRQITAICGGG